MRKIIAIGGGEIRHAETQKIDLRILELTGKKNPKLLFIPTASNDASGYSNTVREYFGKKLGANVSVLELYNPTTTKKLARGLIAQADAIYVGGGNTFRMMRRWRLWGIDKLLKKAWNSGTVMSGLSAGAICWFRYGNSDSRRFKNPQADLIKVSGLAMVQALLCPHYDSEKDRAEDLRRMMKKTAGIAIVLDNNAAIEIIDDQYRIIKSKKLAKARKLFWKDGNFIIEELTNTKEYNSLSNLLAK